MVFLEVIKKKITWGTMIFVNFYYRSLWDGFFWMQNQRKSLRRLWFYVYVALWELYLLLSFLHYAIGISFMNWLISWIVSIYCSLLIYIHDKFNYQHVGSIWRTWPHILNHFDYQGSIRQLLLPSLDDPHGKIRTAVGMAIASIAHYDWPEDWPELLPFLLQLISGQNNIDGGKLSTMP